MKSKTKVLTAPCRGAIRGVLTTGIVSGALAGVLASVVAITPPVHAQETAQPLIIATQPGAADATATTAAQVRGPVTNLPLPRFVSMKASKGNVRRGPSLTHRIDWVFQHRGLPLEITAEHGHWRRVRDRDGAGGWVHYSLLSGARTVIVEDEMVPMRVSPNPGAPEVARLELGVVARVDTCDAEWCRLRAGGYRGWSEKRHLWGVRANEVLE